MKKYLREFGIATAIAVVLNIIFLTTSSLVYAA